MVVRSAELWQELFEACPYNADRRSRGLPMDALLGPDWAEQHAACISNHIRGTQDKHLGFAAGHRRLVPEGLTPDLHFQIAVACDNPLDSLTAVPDDLDFACRVSASTPD